MYLFSVGKSSDFWLLKTNIFGFKEESRRGGVIGTFQCFEEKWFLLIQLVHLIKRF